MGWSLTKPGAARPIAFVLFLAAVGGGCGGKATAGTSPDEREPTDSGAERAPFDCLSFMQELLPFDQEFLACACEACAPLIEACAPENCTAICNGVNPNCPGGATKVAGECIAMACEVPER